MKRFVTIFATLVLGATMATTAMAQAKPAGATSQVKKPAIHKVVHHMATKKKSTSAMKIAKMAPSAVKAPAKATQPARAKEPTKAKAKKAVSHAPRPRTGHNGLKTLHKKSSHARRSMTKKHHKLRRARHVVAKAKHAHKAGKVVNRR